MIQQETEIMTAQEVAAFLRIGKSKLHEIKDQIGYGRVGNLIRFERQSVVQFWESCKNIDKAGSNVNNFISRMSARVGGIRHG